SMEALGFVCVAAVVGLLVGLVIGAVILRSACHLTRSPVPEFGKAMGVVFVAGLLIGFANFGVQFVLALAFQGPGKDPNIVGQLISLAIIIPMDFCLSAAIYSSMLEGVSFGKGLLIYLIQFLIAL